VAAAVATLAARGRGAVELDAMGKTLRAGRQSYAVVRLDGSAWTSVSASPGPARSMTTCGGRRAGRVRPMRRPGGSGLLRGHVRRVRVRDVRPRRAGRAVRAGDADLYDEVAEHAAAEGEEPPPATLGTGTFESATGRTLTEDQMQDGAGVLDALAAAEGFRTLNYGPRATAGAPFEFELEDQPMAVAEAAYVVVR
jgi:hypothetical protein